METSKKDVVRFICKHSHHKLKLKDCEVCHPINFNLTDKLYKIIDTVLSIYVVGQMIKSLGGKK